MPNSKPCSVPGCGRIPPALRRGLCGLHYKRMQSGKTLTDPVQERRSRSESLREAFESIMGTPPEDGCCWEWTRYRDRKGYGQLGLGKRLLYAHRAAYEIYKGPIPDGMKVLHDPQKCNNPPCCNPAHLRIGTHDENMRDMDVAGTRRRGADAPGARLTDDEVREIRDTYAAGGISQAALGARYGVSQTIVSRISRGLIWTHVL